MSNVTDIEHLYDEMLEHFNAIHEYVEKANKLVDALNRDELTENDFKRLKKIKEPFEDAIHEAVSVLEELESNVKFMPTF